jgi:type VI protein secretion system component VasK
VVLGELIVLDTPGATAFPDETSTGKAGKVLTLLRSIATAEPISGFVATIPAEKLLGADWNVLTERTAEHRKRFVQLLRVVGHAFPCLQSS